MRMEEDLFVNFYGDRLACLSRRPEAPVAHIFRRAFVQTEPQRTFHVNVARSSACVHHYGEQHAAFEPCQSRLLRVLRLRLCDHGRRKNVRTQPQDPRLTENRPARRQHQAHRDFRSVQVSFIAQPENRERGLFYG